MVHADTVDKRGDELRSRPEQFYLSDVHRCRGQIRVVVIHFERTKVSSKITKTRGKK
jgi:hypothetical protein